MTSATDALACECARSDEEVVRDRVEGWTVSTRTTDGDDVGCAEYSDTSILWGTNDIRSRNIPASNTIISSLLPVVPRDESKDYQGPHFQIC